MTRSELAAAYAAECERNIHDIRAKKEALEALSGAKTVATVLDPLNALWMRVDVTASKAGLYREVHPDPGVREAADACEQAVQKLITEINLSRPIYDAVAAVDVAGEDAITKRYVANTLRDFRRGGVDRDEATRQRVTELKEKLVTIGQDFGKNIREDVRQIQLESEAQLDGLPSDYIAAHQPGPDGKIVITTDYPDYVPYMTYATNDAKRLELYKVFRSRGYPANKEVLADLLATRHELATLLGYPNWAAYITEDKMIKTAEKAASFIDEVHTLAEPRAKKDYAELLAELRKTLPEATAVGDWQKTFVENRVKEARYELDSKAVREYFAYDDVEQGILDLTSQMFGVTYERVDAPVWHESVKTFDVKENGVLIGRFHLDMHPRTDKYKHAAAFPIQSGVESVRVPEAALVCNFPAGKALMEHGDVETFFHEFGHLLHHLLGGKQRWVATSGFNTEWDFVEAPSQLLEEWAWSYDVLAKFAKNARGEAIPAALVAKMRRARDFGKGLWVTHQMFYAAVSLAYYNQDPSSLDTTETLEALQAKYSLFDYVDDTHFQYSFGHLDGYSAIYYTYMWSLVIAKDLFSRFEQEGILEPVVAARYRQYVLGPGGSVDAADMVRGFLERDYTFEAFARWLDAG